jgi:hypothetical protein
MNKTKIAIVFSGQIRENQLWNNKVELPKNLPDGILHDILESWSKHFFTTEFKENVDYDIFISTDDIDIQKTLSFFGRSKVKNIYLSNSNFYLNPIKSKLASVEFYMDRLYKITDSNYIRYPDGIH